MRIILASGSPRRKELLAMMGLDFEIQVSQTEEKLEENLSLEEQSQKLALEKAQAVFKQTTGDRLVIGSDTIVVKDNRIYGKPNSKEDAIQMIQILQGTDHEVMTSLCVLIEKEGKEKQYLLVDTTKVLIKSMTDEEIKQWTEKGTCMDKAGAYAIQGEFGVFIDRIEGNYYTVMGLPIHKLYEILKEEKIS